MDESTNSVLLEDGKVMTPRWQATIHFDDRSFAAKKYGQTHPSQEAAKSFALGVLDDHYDIAQIKYVEIQRNEERLIFVAKISEFIEGHSYPDDPHDYRICGPYNRIVEIRLI